MNISGFVTLRIQGNNLDFDDICKNIKLQPVQIVRKGERNDKRLSSTQTDIWTYEVAFDVDQDINNVVFNFISTISLYKLYFAKIRKTYSVSLWCDLYSDYAQFGFILCDETINKLAELGLGIEIHLYSHGEFK